ncbi:MAG: hypothetical protein K2K56_14665 [Lachnospiraceae bacterium]|nr:hypothetical protein [Lachnospiraceae bacterium]
MAITGLNNYGSAYENAYGYQKARETEASGQRESKKTELSETKEDAARRSSNEEYLKSIQKQVSYVNLEIGSGLSMRKDNKIGTITINPALLEKMQNDPEAAKQYTQTIKDIERAEKTVMAYYNALGGVVERTSHWYMDENGKYYHFGYVRRDDKLNKKLRAEAQKNAEKLMERTREKTVRNRKELKESLEKKAEEKKKSEELQKEKLAERASEADRSEMGKAEQFLVGKTEQAEDGEIYLDTSDMQVIMEAVKKEEKQGEKAAEGIGTNVDMKI